MICFVIYLVNIYFCKHTFNSFEKMYEKMYDILMIFVEIFHDWADFLLPGSATMVKRNCFSKLYCM